MTSILIIFAYSLILPLLPSGEGIQEAYNEDTEVTIELLNAEEINFAFEIKHQKTRNQIHVRSDEAIRSIQLQKESGKKKSYNAIGSNLIVLPMKDFLLGQTSQLEIRFLNSKVKALVRIQVTKKEDN